MTTSAERIRSYRGPAILSYGFRPLFLLAGAWAAISMTIWIAALSTGFTLPAAYSMLDWHVHELLFAYVPAVVAGFLLTAVPNWTGRLPVTGTPLMLLVLVWLAGRLAMAFSSLTGAIAASVIDLAFLVFLAVVIAREIMAGRNWRNLKVLILVALLFVANAAFHHEAATQGTAATGYSARLGVGVALLLIMVIGGRIIPSFTHNWLARRGPGRLPVPFNRADAAAVGLSAVALALWVARPEGPATAAAFAVAGLLNLWRLWRWAGDRSVSEPLVLVLHAAYLFIPLGFVIGALTMAFSALAAQGTAVHAWTAGVIGLMTLAVMTRASLGHTGQALRATPGTTAIYVAVGASALLRVLSGFDWAAAALLHLAGALWIGGFALFVIIYGPLLAKPRA